MKYILILLLIFNFLEAKSLNFIEKRYVYAIDKTTTFLGKIRKDNNKIVISYTVPIKKLITYKIDKNTLIVRNLENEEIEQIDLNREYQLSFYFSFIKLLFTKDLTLLKKYFKLQKEENGYILYPLEMTSKVIKKITLNLKNDDITKFHIEMKNGDVIDVEKTFTK